ncbi:MAG: DUF447 family protein, partial [Planctomycetaceae bacterium]|nr:DUF447 family protein [Planctomycetaceae bacterium]
SVLHAEIVHSQQRRPFFGFNRARHAVIEAAILATRIHLTGTAAVLTAFETLHSAVDKTGGEEERQAFELLQDYVTHWSNSQHPGACQDAKAIFQPPEPEGLQRISDSEQKHEV